MTTLTAKRGMGVRRACELMGVPRRSFYYRATTRTPRPVDPAVRDAVVQTCHDRPSFGYRRITAMLRKYGGLVVNEKRVRRIMKLEGLALASGFSPPRKRVPRHPGRQITTRPDAAYQLDLKYVWCGRDGNGYLQSVIDCCTSEWLGYVFSKRCGAREACRLLDDVVLDRFPEAGRAPGTRLRVDNGSGFRADRFIEHAGALGFDVEHIQVKTPEDNGVIESLHSGLDRDYLNLEEFRSFDEARAFISKSWSDYNLVKPMKRLGWMTPREYYLAVKPNAT